MTALRHIKQCELIHADIKPDNILVDETLESIKVCDFGTACEVSENEITDYMVSRFYRAPEIILGCKFSYPIDMWSMSCTLYELATGSILFTARNNNNMLYQIMELKGRLPNKLLKSGSFTNKHFSEDFLEFRHQQLSDNKSGNPTHITVRNVSPPIKPVRSIHHLLAAVASNETAQSDDEETSTAYRQLADLIERGLTLDPNKRITPEEALRHPFLKSHEGGG